MNFLEQRINKRNLLRADLEQKRELLTVSNRPIKSTNFQLLTSCFQKTTLEKCC